jgi:bifunctional non-homologous end joining protein LigD
MKAPKPPSGALWLHEIKHDGFRVIARKDCARVRLYSRPGNDLTDRFSLIVEALARLRSRSCIIDGEVVACKARVGIRFNEHLEFDDGEAVFNHACRMGLEGIVSKRKDSPYRSGRSPDWLKMKNPACDAVKREAEEDWGR